MAFQRIPTELLLAIASDLILAPADYNTFQRLNRHTYLALNSDFKRTYHPTYPTTPPYLSLPTPDRPHPTSGPAVPSRLKLGDILMKACEAGWTRVALAALHAGAPARRLLEVYYRDDLVRWCEPLVSAAATGNGVLLRALLVPEWKADVDALAMCPRTQLARCSAAALHHAALRGDVETVEALLEKGAMVDLKDGWGHTPLLLAAKEGRVEVVRRLVSEGADVEAMGMVWGPAMVEAGGCVEVVKVLVGAGAAADLEAMHAFVVNGWVESMRFLVAETPGLLEMRDGFGRTPLMVAARRGAVGMVRGLLGLGAEAGARDAKGCSPLERVLSIIDGSMEQVGEGGVGVMDGEPEDLEVVATVLREAS